MSAKILLLDGLNDAGLCRLLEPLLATIPGVERARIEFLSQRLTLQVAESANYPRLIAQVTDTLREHIPNLTVRFANVADDPAVQAAPPSRFEYVDYSLEREPPEPDDEPSEEEEEDTEADVDEDADEDVIPAPDNDFELQPDTTVLLFGMGVTALLLGLSMIPFLARFSVFLQLVSAMAGIVFILFPPVERWYLHTTPLAEVGAMLAALALLLTGHAHQAVLCALLFQAGRLGTLLLYDRFDRKVERLVDICPPRVLRQVGERLEQVAVEQVLLGDRIVVAAGGTIPFDGIVLEGQSTLRPSIFSDRQEDIAVVPDDPVSCGDKNLDAPLTLSVSSLQELSPAYAVRRMLTDRSGESSVSAQRTRVLEKYLVLLAIFPLVGFGLAVWLGARWLTLLPALLTTLLMLCPAGLSFAVRAAELGTLGRLLGRGIVVKNTASLDALGNLTGAALGCTGVLTSNQVTLRRVEPLPDGVSAAELLRTAAAAEEHSNHPFARAIKETYCSRSGAEKSPSGSNCDNISGYGVRAVLQHIITLVGSRALLDDAGVELPPREDARPSAWISCRGEYIGRITFDCPLRPGADGLAARLGLPRVALLSGADPLFLQEVGAEVGQIDLMPAASPTFKRETLQLLAGREASPTNLLLVTDAGGVDLFSAPCLKAVLGSDALELSLYAADLVIPSADLNQLVEALATARRLRRLERFHQFTSLGLRAALGAAILLGVLPIWAGFAGWSLLGLLSVFLSTRPLG